MKLLLYCTKAKPYLFNQNIYEFYESKYITSTHKFHEKQDYLLNGKIIAECDFEVEEIEKVVDDTLCAYWYETKKLTEIEVLKKSCLMDYELDDYLGGKNGYAIHIKNLHIFDEPKKITAYHCKTNKNDELCLNGGCGYKFFYKAPQNMMKVYDHWGKGNEYVLISIRPEWLCKILNGEKTIEIRKKVLKEMII